MARSILFAGDCDVDLVMSGLARAPMEDREVFCEGFAAAAGGSTLLAAAGYARLGGAAEFCGLAGEDHYGREIAAGLAAAGVGSRLLRMTRDVATAVTLNLVRGSTRTQVTFSGTLGAMDEAARLVAELESGAVGFAHLHVSGVYGMPRFRSGVRGLLEAARRAGLTTSLDTQWDEREEWEGLDSWLPLLDFLFVNADEARSITGRADPAAAWRDLSGRTSRPIVKLGPEGAYAGGRAYPPCRVEVLDPTGAGDTFAAGYLYATIEEGRGPDEAMRFAQAAGAIACTYAGGLGPGLSRAKVLELAGLPPA